MLETLNNTPAFLSDEDKLNLNTLESNINDNPEIMEQNLKLIEVERANLDALLVKKEEERLKKIQEETAKLEDLKV